VLTNVTLTPDDSRATRVEMRFGGSDVDQYTCQLDDQPPVEDCVSPYTMPMLTPGEHTFLVTPIVGAGTLNPPLCGSFISLCLSVHGLEAGAVWPPPERLQIPCSQRVGFDSTVADLEGSEAYSAKSRTWSVEPLFTLEPVDDATVPFNLSLPQAATKTVRVLSANSTSFTARVVGAAEDARTTFEPVVRVVPGTVVVGASSLLPCPPVVVYASTGPCIYASVEPRCWMA
jgi:hypothetical protein